MTLGSFSPERWRELEPLLDAALDLDPSARSAFLDDVCGRDLRLRAELTALLAACERADSILAEPAAIMYERLLIDDAAALPRLLGGRYHIVREIGRGGMATVYLADDPKHGRQVAVKVLHTAVARLIGRERFLREIEIAARLSHPHILPLHDSGEVCGEDADEPAFLYFVSPFVTGESLRDRLRRQPRLAADDALRLGREIAQALDYAHRQGVVHLDVKPENILLQDGHAIIADFGIARAMSSAADYSTRDATPLLGTPSYMSPEQALGARTLDGRSDIYSLGCVLFEAITGERPFARSTSTGAVERAKVPVTPNRSLLLERVSRDVAAMIMRAMAPSREKRFQTAGALALVLSGATRPTRTTDWRRRGIVAICGLATGISSLAVWARHGPVLDPDLIGVAPFDAKSSSLALWREGLVDVMSRNLDGAGALRAVPATVAVRRWQGRADASSARAFGERIGARLVLFGGLLAAGDSVRVTAILLDVRTGQTLAEFEQRDVSGRMDRVSDSLTVAVLRELGRSRHMDMARATSSPTMSLPALKAYLQGEQFYRAALWDSAQARFEHALILDSSFALAYHRLAAVRSWGDPRDLPDSVTLEPRRYPDDAELAFLLAEARWRYDSDVAVGERHDRAILALYDRAIVLDPTFAPAYITPISLAAYLDGPESARRYIRAYLALSPSGGGPRARIIRLDDALLDPSVAGSIDAARLADTLSPAGLCEAASVLRHVADSTELVVRLARAVTNRRPGSGQDGAVSSCAIPTLSNRPHDASGIAKLRADIASGYAHLALARRDTASALRMLLTTRDTLHECWYQNRTALVRLLIAEGRYGDAATRLQRRWPGTSECSDGVDDVVWTLERARVFERIGRRAQAAADYAFVADAWRTADPELQLYVLEARAGIARLRAGERAPDVRSQASTAF